MQKTKIENLQSSELKKFLMDNAKKNSGDFNPKIEIGNEDLEREETYILQKIFENSSTVKEVLKSKMSELKMASMSEEDRIYEIRKISVALWEDFMDNIDAYIEKFLTDNRDEIMGVTVNVKNDKQKTNVAENKNSECKALPEIETPVESESNIERKMHNGKIVREVLAKDVKIINANSKEYTCDMELDGEVYPCKGSCKTDIMRTALGTPEAQKRAVRLLKEKMIRMYFISEDDILFEENAKANAMADIPSDFIPEKEEMSSMYDGDDPFFDEVLHDEPETESELEIETEKVPVSKKTNSNVISYQILSGCKIGTKNRKIYSIDEKPVTLWEAEMINEKDYDPWQIQGMREKMNGGEPIPFIPEQKHKESLKEIIEKQTEGMTVDEMPTLMREMMVGM